MKHTASPRGLNTRGRALLLAALVVWTTAVTAGSTDFRSAGESLARALPLSVLRWTLGEMPREEALSPAASLTLRQSALLYAPREELLQAHGQEEAPKPVPEAVRPADKPAEEAAPETDNGVPARTLVPKTQTGYTVVGKSYISSTREEPLDTEALRQPFSAKLAPSGPQLLILHTHGSEAYTPADQSQVVWSGNRRSTDMRYGVVRVGDAMADEFSAAGISVLHDRTLYDYPSYNESYDRSLAAIERHLAANPSIRFVLDIHRDAIEDKAGNQYKVVSQVPGEGTVSQITLVVGSDGSGAPHPTWMENLRLATALQERLLAEYPTLMRPILLRNSRYNQHAAPGSLLVEVGAAGNSPEEAERAGRIFAREMAQFLQEACKP